jgi:L-alanine-DL-glutamate epimerase-like enolase superfamily enzyme
MRDEVGITTFKVKVGRRPTHLDIAVCRAVREALEDEAEIYVDGNRGWSPTEAAAALPELYEIGVVRVEELCPADDVMARRWLVSQCRVPFLADESVPSPAEIVREVLAGAATGISKTARTGFSDSLRVSHLAEVSGSRW